MTPYWRKFGVVTGLEPLNVYGLRVSNVPNAMARKVPPLGACGLTQSKWVNLAEYLSVPNWA
ncbi:hypothetical protein D3C84_1177990 [compost metagenome]